MTSAVELREQARHYQDAADKLIAAAEVLEGFGQSNGHPPAAAGKRKRRRGRSGGRLEQLKKFLKDNGPAIRQHIIDNAGLPKGTVAYLLKEKNGFAKDEKKLWHVAN